MKRAGVSPRQNQVAELLRQGRTNKQIAVTLGIGVGTVKTHVIALRYRLGACNRTEAAALAQRLVRHRKSDDAKSANCSQDAENTREPMESDGS